MKRLLLGMLLCASAAVTVAQKTIVNDANAAARTVDAFTKIHVSSAVDLYLSQGDENAVAVSAIEVKYRDRIKTEVKDGTLKIWYDTEGISWGSGNKKLRAYVSVKTLREIHASGASDVFINGTVKAADLNVHLSGASDLSGRIEATNLDVHVSGASDMKVSGAVGNLNIHAGGASDFKGYDLTAQTCDADASGASSIYITVEKTLNADAGGASDIHYKGNAVIKKFNSGGASTVKKVSK